MKKLVCLFGLLTVFVCQSPLLAQSVSDLNAVEKRIQKEMSNDEDVNWDTLYRQRNILFQVVPLYDKTEVAVSDSYFRDYLLKNWDVDQDRRITKWDMENVTMVDLTTYEDFSKIKSLQGIESCKNLLYLNCSGCPLRNLSLSNPRLQILICNDCQLSSLDCSKLLSLEKIDISNNPNVQVSQRLKAEVVRNSPKVEVEAVAPTTNTVEVKAETQDSVVAVSSTPNKAWGLSVYFGGVMPLHAFGQGVGAPLARVNDFGTVGSAAFGVSVGIRYGYTFKCNAGVFVSADLMYNGVQKKARNQYDLAFGTHPSYLNLPLMVGATYSHDWGKVGLWAEVGVGCNLLFKTKDSWNCVNTSAPDTPDDPDEPDIPIIPSCQDTIYTVVDGVLDFPGGAKYLKESEPSLSSSLCRYKMSFAFAAEVGVGVRFFNKLSLSVHYYWLGMQKIQPVNASSPATKLGTGALALKLGFHL